MTLFTKEMMWKTAVGQMGAEKHHGWLREGAIVLYTSEDVEELYEALKEAHEKAVEKK